MGDIRCAVDGYKAGRFQAASQPTVDSHFGMGTGRSAGMGPGTMSPPGPPPQSVSPGQGLEALKSQAQMLGQQLNEMLCRIEELEKKGG